MPCKKQPGSGRNLNDKIPCYYQHFLSLYRLCVYGIHRLLTVIKYRGKFYESRSPHHSGYIIADDIVTRCQRNRTAITQRNILFNVRYLHFERNTGAFRNNQLFISKRRKYAVLRITRGTCRPTRTWLSSWPHGTGGPLWSLRPRDSLWAGFPSLTGAAWRAGLPSWPHWPRLPALTINAGRLLRLFCVRRL